MATHTTKSAVETESQSPATASSMVFVDQFTDGVLDPARPMLGPVCSGGHIVAHTAPGCWGPMITPSLRGGHEVTRPVAVEGAEIGDAIAIRIRDLSVTSLATASGNDEAIDGRFQGDPYVAACCRECGTVNPETTIDGIGPKCIRCAHCGAEAAPFRITHGYTIRFDDAKRVGVTLPEEAARQIAEQAKQFAALPEQSCQNPILTFAPHDMVGVVARLRPFLGQLGTTPAIPMPDSHNAGDFGQFLIDAPHDFGISADQLSARTDGHMDIDCVRGGAVVICPVKVSGGGVYVGDMHAMQGDGEIAGHTCDVAGLATLQVHLLKGLAIDGPILFPVLEDVPYLARPFSKEETASALAVARAHGMRGIEQTLPISFVGTGPTLNAATDCGLERAATLLEMEVAEVRNRATISGAIEIGRHPGVVQVTFLVPVERLEKIGLLEIAARQYPTE